MLGLSRGLGQFLQVAPQALHDLPLNSVLLDLPPPAYYADVSSSSSLPLLAALSAKLRLPPYEAPLAGYVVQPQACFKMSASFAFQFVLSWCLCCDFSCDVGDLCADLRTFVESRFSPCMGVTVLVPHFPLCYFLFSFACCLSLVSR